MGAIAHMALAMQAAMADFPQPDGTPFELRIGIHVGPAVAGVVGSSKFSYDLWGDTVNVASRMEATGQPGKIQVTAAIYRQLRDRFVFAQRGVVRIKGKGWLGTYWLLGLQPRSSQAHSPDPPPTEPPSQSCPSDAIAPPLPFREQTLEDPASKKNAPNKTLILALVF
jgi:class 3 adenylate cyclase